MADDVPDLVDGSDEDVPPVVESSSAKSIYNTTMKRFTIKRFVRERGLYEPPTNVEEVIDLTSQDKAGEEVSTLYRQLVMPNEPDPAAQQSSELQEISTFFCETCKESMPEVLIAARTSTLLLTSFN